MRVVQHSNAWKRSAISEDLTKLYVPIRIVLEKYHLQCNKRPFTVVSRVKRTFVGFANETFGCLQQQLHGSCARLQQKMLGKNLQMMHDGQVWHGKRACQVATKCKFAQGQF